MSELIIKNVKQSAINIYANSKIIKKQIDADKVKISTGYYDISLGKVTFHKTD